MIGDVSMTAETPESELRRRNRGRYDAAREVDPNGETMRGLGVLNFDETMTGDYSSDLLGCSQQEFSPDLLDRPATQKRADRADAHRRFEDARDVNVFGETFRDVAVLNLEDEELNGATSGRLGFGAMPAAPPPSLHHVPQRSRSGSQQRSSSGSRRPQSNAQQLASCLNSVGSAAVGAVGRSNAADLSCLDDAAPISMQGPLTSDRRATFRNADALNLSPIPASPRGGAQDRPHGAVGADYDENEYTAELERRFKQLQQMYRHTKVQKQTLATQNAELEQRLRQASTAATASTSSLAASRPSGGRRVGLTMQPPAQRNSSQNRGSMPPPAKSARIPQPAPATDRDRAQWEAERAEKDKEIQRLRRQVRELQLQEKQRAAAVQMQQKEDDGRERDRERATEAEKEVQRLRRQVATLQQWAQQMQRASSALPPSAMRPVHSRDA